MFDFRSIDTMNATTKTMITPTKKRYEIEKVGLEFETHESVRRRTLWRIVGRLENGQFCYRGNAIYSKSDAREIAATFNQVLCLK
jgi:hypothetical protein